MYLVLVRHGESVWNKENKFTGWTDVELSFKGIEEARTAGKLLKNENIGFDLCFTSVLKRANDTLKYILDELNSNCDVKNSYKLNERHYGALQGLNKDETKDKYGEEQVKLWRRSYDVRPPELSIDDDRCPANDIKYSDIPKDELPRTESLKDTYKRVVEYYEDEIKKHLEKENVLIVAHGNSLRALIKYLENIGDEDIVSLEIPTGVPIIYKLDEKLEIVEKRTLQ